MPKRYHSIDIAKGVCILFVIVAHYEWKKAEQLRLLFPFWVDMAVPIFMIISGYVYTRSFQKNRICAVGDAYTVKNVLGKLIRYTVPFIIAFIIEEVAYNHIGIVQHDAALVVRSFFRGGFGPGSYYYPIMIQFIFYFPIVFAIIRKYDFHGVILCGFINLSYEVLKHYYGMSQGCYRFLVFRYTLLIGYGCYLAMGNYRRHLKLSVLCTCIGIGYIITCVYMDHEPPITDLWTGTSLWASLFVIPISGPLLLNKMRSRFMETVGRASYDIFLVQMVYYKSADLLVYRHIDSRPAQLLINIVVCVTVGLIFYYVETPLTKRIHDAAYRTWDMYLSKKQDQPPYLSKKENTAP